MVPVLHFFRYYLSDQNLFDDLLVLRHSLGFVLIVLVDRFVSGLTTGCLVYLFILLITTFGDSKSNPKNVSSSIDYVSQSNKTDYINMLLFRLEPVFTDPTFLIEVGKVKHGSTDS